MASKVSRIEFAAIVAVLLLSSSVSGTFVYVEIIERTPPIGKIARGCGKAPGVHRATHPMSEIRLTEIECVQMQLT
eukprot:3390311-Rhodomonas_salina.1